MLQTPQRHRHRPTTQGLGMFPNKRTALKVLGTGDSERRGYQRRAGDRAVILYLK